MNEHPDNQDSHPPRWVPYTPPAPDGWDRARLILRRLSFPFVVVLLAGGLAAVLFYWGPEPESGETESPPSANVLPSGLQEETGDPSSTGSAQLRVRSSPTGASVRVNGDSVGVTPFSDSTHRAGVYMLSVQRKGHFRADTVVVLNSGSAATVRLALRPRPDYEGTSTGSAAVSSRRTAGERRAEQNGSAPIPTARSSGGDAAPETPPAFGALYVTSTPSGANVTLNGQERGRTPLPLSKLSTGRQRMAVSLGGHQVWTAQVEVTADTTTRVHVDLQPKTGRLRVLARPWGTIYINEALHARESDVWYETTLPIGEHQVTVVHPALGTQTREVAVRAGEESSVIVDLRPQRPDSSSP